MEINGDFTRRAVMHGDELAWQPSPMAGVSRRMLDRIGDEVDKEPGFGVRFVHGFARDQRLQLFRCIGDFGVNLFCASGRLKATVAMP